MANGKIAKLRKMAGRGRRSAPLLMTAIASIAALMTGLTCADAAAQSAPPAMAVPTTKVLAIGSFTEGATPKAWMPLIPKEARETAELYFQGKIDQWYLKQDLSGVVFMMNVTDAKDADALLDKLPLGQAGLMKFQYIALGPLAPLRLALTELPK